MQRKILENQQITIRDLSTAMKLSIGTVYNTVHKELGYCKMCACWVPRCLMEQHKNQCFEITLSYLQQFTEEENEFLKPTLKSNETWVHHFTPQTKQAGLQWKYPTSPKAKKFKMYQSAEKVMASVIWNTKGVIQTKFMPWGTTINANAYCNTRQ
jgi:hypothetical protein